MNVGDLKKLLEVYSSDTEIVLSSDAEGNNFSPLIEATRQLYVAHNDYSGQCYCDEDEIEENDYKTVVCLWPTN